MNFNNSPFHVICNEDDGWNKNRTTHVHFNRGYLVATNDIILAAMPLGSDELNGYRIHAHYYKLIYKSLSIEPIEINGEKWLMADGKICVPLEKSDEFPDEWPNLFEQEKKPIDSIRLNQEFIAMASNVLLSNELNFSFSAKNKGIIVTSLNTEIKVVLMPLYSHDD